VTACRTAGWRRRKLHSISAYDDPFLVCADYASYLNCQEQVSAAWQDRELWTKMSILNTARSGKLSSDRAIAEYCDDIWQVWPLTVTI
jgi:starch phosphorylase